jgi:hypothetical protein
MTEEKLRVMDDVTEVCEIVRISLIICSQKCHLNLLKFQKILGVKSEND